MMLRCVLGVLILAILLWFTFPVVLCRYLNQRGRELPDYICHINSVQLDVLPCGLNLNGVSLVKRAGDIPVPFLQCPRVHIALQWSEILHGSARSNITMTRPLINFVQGPTKNQSQTFLEPEWVQEVKHLVPWRINRFEVQQGDLHYYEFDASPRINLEMDQVNVTLDNLTNSRQVTSEFPSTAVVTGRPFKRGRLEIQMAMNVDEKEPTFKDQIQLQNIPAPALNAYLAKTISVYAKSGDLAFYSEMISEKGAFNGYLRPYFQGLAFEPMPKDRSGIAAIWAGIMNGVKDVFENDKNVVATQIPVSGNYKDPNLDFWSAAFGIVKNAWFKALAQGFKSPQLAPAPAAQTPAPSAASPASP